MGDAMRLTTWQYVKTEYAWFRHSPCGEIINNLDTGEQQELIDKMDNHEKECDKLWHTNSQ